MKIVDVCAFYTPHGGGVKTYIEQKLIAGPKLGHEIVIIAPGDGHEVIERGPMARIVTLPSPRFPLDKNYWYFADEAALHAALDAEKPDIVEVSSPWRSPNWVASWKGSAPRALVMHADPLSAYAYRWFGPIFSQATIDALFSKYWRHICALGQNYDRIVCANEHLRSRLAEGGVANTELQPMGIEGDVFSPDRRDTGARRDLLDQCHLDEGAKLLIGIGRLGAEKRWPMVIEAVRKARKTRPIGLIILGDGLQRAKIEKLIANDPHIKLLSPVRDRERFATILASADALIHGCEAETFSMAAAEARASGVPVIVPDQGGASDHAANGAGICYKSADANAAAAAIVELFDQSAPVQPLQHNIITMDDHFRALFEDYEKLVALRRK